MLENQAHILQMNWLSLCALLIIVNKSLFETFVKWCEDFNIYPFQAICLYFNLPNGAIVQCIF